MLLLGSLTLSRVALAVDIQPPLTETGADVQAPSDERVGDKTASTREAEEPSASSVDGSMDGGGASTREWIDAPPLVVDLQSGVKQRALSSGEEDVHSGVPALEQKKNSSGSAQAVATQVAEVPEAVSSTKVLDAEAYEIEEVVVTGSRTQRPMGDAPVVTDVISGESIQASGAQTVADVLEEHPAIFITRNYAGARIQIQGLDSAYTLILVDGQRTAGRVGGVIDLTRLSTENIERIEIVRGSASSLYGSDAIGGVVNIITKKSTKKLEGSASAAYGNLGLLDATATGGFDVGKLNARMTASFHSGNGFDYNPEDIATNGNAFRQVNVSSRASYRGSEKSTWDLSADYTYRDQHGIDMSTTGAVFDRANRSEQVGVRVGPSLTLKNGGRLQAWAGYSFFRDQFLQDQRKSVALDQVQDTREHLTQFGTQADWFVGGSHIVSMGMEGFYQYLQTERLAAGWGQRGRAAVYVQDEWIISDEIPRLVFVPGARFDVDSQFGAHPSPRLAIRLDPHDDVALRASYGRGFRAPNFREMYLNFQNPSAGYRVVGNPSLRPEVSNNLNISVDYDVTTWMRWSTAAFHNRLEGMIVARLAEEGTQNGTRLFRYENVSAATTLGTDTGVHLSAGDFVSFHLSYAFLRTLDEELARPLQGRPAHRGTAEVNFVQRVWRTRANVRSSVVGSRAYFSDANGDDIDERTDARPYVTVDARVEQGVGEYFSLFVLGENLLDAGHESYLPIQPRTVMGGANVRY